MGLSLARARVCVCVALLFCKMDDSGIARVDVIRVTRKEVNRRVKIMILLTM